MNVGELLDKTFKMFLEQLKTYLIMAVLGAIPAVGLSLLALAVYYYFGEGAGLVAMVVAAIPSGVVYFAMTGGLIKMASEQIAEQEISIKEAYRFGFRRAWPLFVGSLLYVGAMSIGFILLLIPGIYLFTRFALYGQAIIIEGKGPVSAFGRSTDLIKGSWWRSFAIIALIIILMSILSNIGSFPLSLLSSLLFGESFIGLAMEIVLTTPITFLVAPFTMIALTLFYYDLRIRQENLDLKLMVDNLTESSDQETGE
jgi:hypothetical protein